MEVKKLNELKYKAIALTKALDFVYALVSLDDIKNLH